MVLVNGSKFACQSCIKGHRSSSCGHVDRPLFEIRKKGRPVTQCDTCRELRRTKKLHVKCLCDGRKDPAFDVGPVEIQSTTSPTLLNKGKGGRKIPIIPRLPNGVRDLEGSIPPISPIISTPKEPISSGIEEGTSLADSLSYTQPRPVDPPPSAGAGPIRSCCARKRAAHSRSSSITGPLNQTSILVEQTSQELQNRLTSLLDDNLITPTPSNQGGSSIKDVLPSNNEVENSISTGFFVLDQDSGMECLCGPSCLCLGCKTHRHPGDDILSERGSHAFGCPPDCPSCIDNECGPVLLTTYLGSATSSAYYAQDNPISNVNLAQTSLSQMREDGWGPALSPKPEWDWRDLLEDDEELDAEGSPDPDFRPLPVVSDDFGQFRSSNQNVKGLGTSDKRRELRQSALWEVDKRDRIEKGFAYNRQVV
ncbi:hypothetical protein CPB86DRAFT_780772 [Serendipita vermifera]|nr:hypothetical protein CPB86DRAFT_780772 [Serendipita vermifera]